MRCNPVYIIHHPVRIVKNFRIYLLQCVMHTQSALIAGDLVGVINMTGAKWNSNYEVTVNYKLFTNFMQFLLPQHLKSLFIISVDNITSFSFFSTLTIII